MLMQKAVNIDIEREILSEYDLAALLEDKATNASPSKQSKMTVLKMII